MKSMYSIEVTDTFGGESNYSWVRRYLVEAKSIRGAVKKLASEWGSGWRVNYSDGDTSRYDLKGACICAFVSYCDDVEIYCDRYSFGSVVVI